MLLPELRNNTVRQARTVSSFTFSSQRNQEFVSSQLGGGGGRPRSQQSRSIRMVSGRDGATDILFPFLFFYSCFPPNLLTKNKYYNYKNDIKHDWFKEETEPLLSCLPATLLPGLLPEPAMLSPAPSDPASALGAGLREATPLLQVELARVGVYRPRL